HLHPVQVGAEVELGRQEPVATPVPRQEDEPRATEPADHELVGRVAEGRLQPPALDTVEPGQLVEPTPSDDAESPFVHAPEAARGSGHTLGKTRPTERSGGQRTGFPPTRTVATGNRGTRHGGREPLPAMVDLGAYAGLAAPPSPAVVVGLTHC